MTSTVATSRAQAVADLNAGTIVATIEIATSAERLFHALTDPHELMAWWGSPETYRAHAWTSDLRIGGRWRVEGKSAAGQPYSVSGEFLEITPPRRLVHTWLHDWDPGHPPTTVTYTIDDVPGGMRLTVHHEGFAGRPESCAGHANGWERVTTWLAAYVNTHTKQGS
jgi:uncharacterized protein YndB with AHSA1/START domain